MDFRFFMRAVTVGLIGGILMLNLFGCFSPKPAYAVDYDGRKSSFEGAKDRYAAGETVTLYYGLIATDTDYAFLLDGEPLNVRYDDQKGFVISFTMPEHDVKLTVTQHNSMEWDGFSPEETLTFHSYDGGGPRYAATIADPAVAACRKSVEYDKPDHAQLDGAGYDVTFTLTGKNPGTTTVTVTCEFKGNTTEEIHTVTVNDALQIRIES